MGWLVLGHFSLPGAPPGSGMLIAIRSASQWHSSRPAGRTRGRLEVLGIARDEVGAPKEKTTLDAATLSVANR
jgi:hypothetical protein